MVGGLGSPKEIPPRHRQSNIELLCLLCMLMVLNLHSFWDIIIITGITYCKHLIFLEKVYYNFTESLYERSLMTHLFIQLIFMALVFFGSICIDKLRIFISDAVYHILTKSLHNIIKKNTIRMTTSYIVSQMSNRLSWVDNVKMVAMLFVILGHTWRIIHCPLPEWLSLFILSFNMPLFVLMTGYTSVRGIDKIATIQNLKDYLFKTTKRVMLPSAVFSIAVSIVVLFLKYVIDDNDFSWSKVIVKLIILSIYVIAFIYRNHQKGKFLFSFLCIMAIPISLKFSMFWFLNMTWCVCGTVAISTWILKKIKLNEWGGYFCCIYLLSLFH